ncbi:MAG: hypothetical protein V4732_13630 [Pseudomonadota bacterium]
MARQPYTSCVFINCPFDEEYKSIRDAIVFAIYDCGFIPRCALEENNGGNIRFDKIQKIIGECKFGVHDISRTELDIHNGLPRFNMPLELGVFLGAKRFGSAQQRTKNCLILDRDQYRYQQFISDIAGQDIRSHNSDADQVIGLIRGWLSDASGRRTIPGGRDISRRYAAFLATLPHICLNARLELGELTFNDFSVFASGWLLENGAVPA